MIFALGAPQRGQMSPDPARFAISGSPYVPLDSRKPMKVTRFERLFLVFSLLTIGLAEPRAQPRRIVIAAGRILDGRGRVLPASRIVVEGSKINMIGANSGPV